MDFFFPYCLRELILLKTWAEIFLLFVSTPVQNFFLFFLSVLVPKVLIVPNFHTVDTN